MHSYAARCCRFRFAVLALLLCSFHFLWLLPAYSQVASPATPPTPPQSWTTSNQQSSTTASETISQGASSTYKLDVNLVQVRVVVRDSQGKPVANLKKEDFLLIDNGKPQFISTFSMETPTSRMETLRPALASSPALTPKA
jgi:hypothetical protein